MKNYLFELGYSYEVARWDCDVLTALFSLHGTEKVFSIKFEFGGFLRKKLEKITQNHRFFSDAIHSTKNNFWSRIKFNPVLQTASSCPVALSLLSPGIILHTFFVFSDLDVYEVAGKLLCEHPSDLGLSDVPSCLDSGSALGAGRTQTWCRVLGALGHTHVSLRDRGASPQAQR